MKRYSIFYSITFISILTVVSIILAFLYLIAYDKNNYTNELNLKYSSFANATLSYINGDTNREELDTFNKNYKLTEIIEEPYKSYIIHSAEVLDDKKGTFGRSSILFYNKNTYLVTANKGIIMLFKDEGFQSYRYKVIQVIFGLILIVVIAAYIYIIKKIKPLKRLKRQIEKFAQGDLDMPAQQEGNDEISELSNAFYNSVHQIKKMNHSRQLFLRNIMHELKTPITKGRICVEMIEESKQKHRLINVFERLEVMINEFASIEKLTSGKGLTKKTEARRLVDILDEAIDVSMVDRENIDSFINQDIVLNVDFKLFSLAIKNLLDNGIKYSYDKRVKITTDNNSIHFHSKGRALDNSFEHYLEPFIQGDNSPSGMGLGLYIVDNIIKAHGLLFTYKYQDGINIFSFINLRNIS